jgi:integrase
MAWQRESKPRGRTKVVRKILADGKIKLYEYSRDKRPDNRAGTVGALLVAYKTSSEWRALRQTTQAFYLRYLEPLMGIAGMPVQNLKRRDILAMRDGFEANGTPGAATSFVRCVSALMTWAVDREWIEHSPALRVKRPKGGHLRTWTEAEYEHALTVLPEPLRRAIVLARHTGQRRGDLVAMPWSAYDGATVRLRQQKTGAPLVIPVTADLRRELDTWPRVAPLILTTHTGRAWSANYLSHAVTAALPGLPLHGLRKLAATSLAEAGCSIHEIAAVTGHASLAMVQLYTRAVQQEQLAGAAILRLDQARKSRP